MGHEFTVHFFFDGKLTNGTLSKVSGAGASMWHLTVDNYHWAQVWRTELYGWRCGSNHKDIGHLGTYFGECIDAYIKSAASLE